MDASKNTNPLVYLFSETWRHSAGHRGKVIGYWALLITAMGFNLIAEPFLLAKIISIVVSEGVTESNLMTLFGLLGLFILVDVLFWAFHGPARVIECLNSFRVRASYSKHLLSGIMALPVAWHVEHHSGDTIDKVGKGTSGLHDFAEGSFEVIYLGVRLIVSYAALAWFSVPSAIIALAMTGIAFYLAAKFDGVLMKQQVVLNRKENSIAESINDSISKIMTVITVRAEKNSLKKIAAKIDEPLELYRKHCYVVEVKWFVASMCCAVMLTTTLGLYFYQHFGIAAAGTLASSTYLLMNYLDKISKVFYEFNGMYGDIIKRRTRVANAEEIAKEFKPKQSVEQSLPQGWKTLEIRDLNFSYHDKEGRDRHLKHVSLAIKHGQRIAFVGETGSGKTTLLSLLRSLYTPESAEVAVDGKTLENGLADIAESVALIPQTPEIFATTVRENITMGGEYDAHLIQQFTDMACFSEVVTSLPKGLESTTKEKGVNFSGGQQQRLALARGLLAAMDREILLLDEPTSSLDAATERAVYQNVFRGFLGKTVISTVHRLHLLPHFDKIFLFEEGKIIASGTLAELLATSPEFQHMWEKGQAEVALTA